jgi:hypothetical protein
MRWMVREEFCNCCYLAEWEDEWVMDLFKSILNVDESIRKYVTTQCVNGLKFLAKLNEESGYMVTYSTEGGGSSSDQFSGEHNHTLNESKTWEKQSSNHLVRYRVHKKNVHLSKK